MKIFRLTFAGAAAILPLIGYSQTADPGTGPGGLPPLPMSSPAAQAPADNVSTISDSLPPPAPIAPGEAAAVSNLQNPDFIRGIYVDALGPALRSDTGIRKMVHDVRQAGFDTVFAQVRINGDALYNSQIEPRARNLPEGFDPLATLLKEAHSGDRPLKVHAMLVVYRVWSKAAGDAPDQHVAHKHPEWMTQTEDGRKEVGDQKNEYWLDPGLPAVQDYLAAIATDIAQKYEIDGLHLDRIRYPEPWIAGYNPAAVARYNAEKNKSGTPPSRDPEWADWRRAQVTETVRKMRESVRAVRPNAVFSVGGITFGSAPGNMEEYRTKSTPYVSLFEDFIGWAEEGIINLNVLMDYKSAKTHAADFEKWMEFAIAHKGKAKVAIAVAGWLNEPKQTLGMMIQPVMRPASDGAVLYSYHQPASGASQDVALAMIKKALDPAVVQPKISELARASTAAADASARINRTAAVLTGEAVAEVAEAPTPQPEVAAAPPSQPAEKTPAPTPAVEIPPLAEAAPKTEEKTEMPALAAAQENQTPAALPSLSAVQQEVQSTLPSLEAAAEIERDSGAAIPSLSAAVEAEDRDTGIPSLSAAAQPATEALPPLQALPEAPSAAELSARAETVEQETTIRAQRAEAHPVERREVQPLSEFKESTLTPFQPPANPEVASITQDVSPITKGPTVSIPDYGPSTNYTGQPIAGGIAPVQITPPTVLTPAPGTGQAAKQMPLPAVPDRAVPAPGVLGGTAYDEKESPYGTPTPIPGLHYYAPPTGRRPTTVVALPSGAPEVITLTSGKQFTGFVLERGGKIWRIQLLDGSVIALPETKIARVQSTEPIAVSQ